MADVTVDILGSGTCFPARGMRRRAHPGFLVRWEQQHLLLDVSSGIAERLEDIGVAPDDIQNVAVSHAHPDHFALPQFLQSMYCAFLSRPQVQRDARASQKLQLFLPRRIVKGLDDLLRLHFEERDKPGLPFPTLNVSGLTPFWHDPSGALNFVGGDQTEHLLPSGDLLVAYPVHHGHGKCDAVALRLEIENGPTISYSGDTGMCSGILQAAEGADLFICDTSARVGDELTATGYGHLNPRQAGDIAGRVGAKRLVLTHYSGHDSDAEMVRNCRESGFLGDIIVAKDNMQLVISSSR